jgi:hypothetical protein
VHNNHTGSVFIGLLLAAVTTLTISCGTCPAPEQTAESDYHWSYVVVEPGTHPGIIFSEQELPALRKRAAGQGMAADAWAEIKQSAAQDYNTNLTVEQAVGRQGWRLSHQLECMALVWQLEGDEATGRKAIEILDAIATGIDPLAFYREVDSDFFATEHWPKAFAFAWDWLYNLMNEQERSKILAGLEEWNAALYDHTESWWWRDAGYNCGAIPVGAQGMLLAAIRGESKHPDLERWFSDCWRKVSMNYFPQTWDDNGICNEGPGYAHYHKNPTQFAEAVRRTGGPDIIAQSGAVNAMHFLRHQWMPQGGCGPVADNTEYGRRVFQAIYLHGIRELGDAAGLWTFEKYTDRNRYNDVLVFLLYPDGLEPVPPGTLDLRTSYYFEIDHNRAGHLFARNEWDNEQAHWFVFTTQYANANHSHTDMNSFLFTAFGEPFATHENLYSYSHEHHGADIEHNIVIIDQGGLPANDRKSAGDDGDLDGFLTGIGTGHFADYARGDARMCYADRSDASTTGAVRADRMMIFAKQGPNPYVVVADDIQKDGREHDYHWQWYTEEHEAVGAGTFESPLVIEGDHSNCAIAFYEPAAPEFEFSIAHGGSSRRPYDLGLLKVNRRGVRVRYLAVAAAWRDGEREPLLSRGPEVEGCPSAASVVVESDGYRDMIVWQPEELIDNPGRELICGGLVTDALIAMVRIDGTGNVVGYVMGDGSHLEYDSQILARGDRQFSVSADAIRTVATGPRRARQGLDPLPVVGTVWLPAQHSEIWVDGERLEPPMGPGRMAIIDSVRCR